MEHYSAIRKDEILPLATTWMDLEDIMLSEISSSEKPKHRMTILTVGYKLKLRQPRDGYRREGGGS